MAGSEERKHFVAQSCQKHTELMKNVSELTALYPFVNTQFKWVHCAVPKVATTTLRSLFAALHQQSSDPRENLTTPLDRDFGFKTLVSYSKPEVDSILGTSFKTVFIRHPFERLVSYYDDKIRAYNPPRDSWALAAQIRWVWFHVSTRFRNMTQSESNRVLPEFYDITFEEFIEFVVDWTLKSGRKPNEHWQEIVDVCFPCSEKYKYDYIGSIYSFETDVRVILKLIGAQNLIKLLPNHYRPSTDRNRVDHYFQRISHGTRLKLATLFEKDAKIFGFRL